MLRTTTYLELLNTLALMKYTKIITILNTQLYEHTWSKQEETHPIS